MSTYVRVKEETDKRLHLVREPSMRAWAILVGLISLGTGAAYYSTDYLLWKLAYVSGAVFMGLTCMEDWEECIFDKEEGKVSIKKMGLVQRFFQDPSHHHSVVAELSELNSVSVEQETVKYSGTGYQVVLHFASGYSIGVTETATMGGNSDHEIIAEKIKAFLQVEDAHKDGEYCAAAKSDSPDRLTVEHVEPEATPLISFAASPNTENIAKSNDQASPAEANVSARQPESDSSSDEDFEKIEHAEVMLVQEVEKGADPPPCNTEQDDAAV